MPLGFSDHHLFSMTIVMSKLPKKSSYWHLKVKLLHDAIFCDNFNLGGGVLLGGGGY